jgi:hypothetical protein
VLISGHNPVEGSWLLFIDLGTELHAILDKHEGEKNYFRTSARKKGSAIFAAQTVCNNHEFSRMLAEMRCIC